LAENDWERAHVSFILNNHESERLLLEIGTIHPTSSQGKADFGIDDFLLYAQ